MPHIIKLSDKDRNNFLSNLALIKKDPERAIIKARRNRNIVYVIGCIPLLVVFMFYNSLPLFVSFILVAIFSMLVTFSALYGDNIKNISLIVEIVDWGKVKKIRDDTKVK